MEMEKGKIIGRYLRGTVYRNWYQLPVDPVGKYESQDYPLVSGLGC